MWNIDKLGAELTSALGQPVTPVLSDDLQVLEIEYTVPAAADVIKAVVQRHVADATYSIKTTGGQTFIQNGDVSLQATGDVATPSLGDIAAYLGDVDILLPAQDTAPDTPSAGVGRVYYGVDEALHLLDENAQSVNVGKVIPTQNSTYSDSVAETTIVSTVIMRNTGSAVGWQRLAARILVEHADASVGRNVTLKFVFGAYTMTLASAHAVGTNNRNLYFVEVWVSSEESGNEQLIIGHVAYAASPTINTLNTPTANQIWWGRATEDMALNDTNMYISAQLSHANTTFSVEAFGSIDGPYYIY